MKSEDSGAPGTTPASEKPSGGMRMEDRTDITHKRLPGESEAPATSGTVPGETTVPKKVETIAAENVPGFFGKISRSFNGTLTKAQYEESGRFLGKPAARIANNLGQGSWLAKKPLAAVSLGSAVVFGSKAVANGARYVNIASLKKDENGKEIPVSAVDVVIPGAVALGSLVLGGIGGARGLK